MGFRFRKSIKLFPGVRLNVSKSGTSFTVGRPGASINVGKRGRYANIGIPGTGLSWRVRLDTQSGRSRAPQRCTNCAAALEATQPQCPSCGKRVGARTPVLVWVIAAAVLASVLRALL